MSALCQKRTLQASWCVEADLDSFGNGDSGPLSIGTYQSVGARILPTLLRDFRAEWPKVDIRLVESADDRELLELVERGEVDVSFCVFPLEGGPFESVELMRDPYVLVVAADSPLAGREKAPTLREILELPLISYRTCRTTARVEERLRVAGREPDVVFRSDDNGTLQALVAAGVGVALVPRLTVDLDDGSIAVIELGDRVPPRIIGVAWHADRQLTPAAQMFIQAAEEVCRSKRLPQREECGNGTSADAFFQLMTRLLEIKKEIQRLSDERREICMPSPRATTPRLSLSARRSTSVSPNCGTPTALSARASASASATSSSPGLVTKSASSAQPPRKHSRPYNGTALWGHGALAQLGERRLCKPEVAGSIPARSTFDFQGNLVPQD